MKIEILVSTALVNQDSGRTAGLHETVDAPKERAEYLIGIGAARPAVEEPEKAAETPEDDDETPEEPKGPAKPASPARKPSTPARKPSAK